MKLPFGNKYVVDTDVLITLMKHYPPNKPAFKAIWDEIENLIKQKNIFSTSVVYDEIMKYEGKDDRLRKWAKAHKKRFFIPTNSEIFQLAKDITKVFPDLSDKKKLQTGEPDADPFIIALAQSEGAAIVTQEKKDNPNKIPTVADHYNIKSIDIFEFFAERGLKFIKEQ
jgi:predicted nucleic acid-binding protein